MNSLERISEISSEEFEKLYRENQELKSFAYLVSHDLKAPLRHIKNYTKILRENLNEKLNIEDADTNHVCSVIESSVTKMDGMIDNLINLWLVKSNSSYFEDVNLNIICAKVVTTILETTNDNQLYNIKWENLPTIKGDNAQMFQILMNLCSNAVKYQSKNNNPEVSIEVEEQGNHWLISVIDNGLGVVESKRKVIFEPFTRLNKDSEYAGNGLGLSICKKIAENHKGRIWVEPNQEVGSVFSFTVNKTL